MFVVFAKLISSPDKQGKLKQLTVSLELEDWWSGVSVVFFDSDASLVRSKGLPEP